MQNLNTIQVLWTYYGGHSLFLVIQQFNWIRRLLKELFKYILITFPILFTIFIRLNLDSPSFLLRNAENRMVLFGEAGTLGSNIYSSNANDQGFMRVFYSLTAVADEGYLYYFIFVFHNYLLPHIIHLQLSIYGDQSLVGSLLLPLNILLILIYRRLISPRGGHYLLEMRRIEFPSLLLHTTEQTHSLLIQLLLQFGGGRRLRVCWGSSCASFLVMRRM